MRLANDEITIALGTRSFVLRASLRAAQSLYRKYNGYHNLSRAIAAGSFTASCDVIGAACTNPRGLGHFAATTAERPLADAIISIRDDLLEFVLILSGANHKNDDRDQPSEPMTFEAYHTKLYQLGTGWLGWTPEATWNATPAEIINAFTGRQDMLKAVFGKRDDTETIERTDGKLKPDLKAQLNALGDLRVTSMSGVR